MKSSIGTSCMTVGAVCLLRLRAIALALRGPPASATVYNRELVKFYIRTYGCQMNVADSNEMGRHLKARGLVETQDPEDASIYLVNTCTVRQHAEDRAFSEIGRLKKWKAKEAGRKLVITGCAAERTKEYLENRFPHVDLIVGAKSIEDFGTIVDGLLERRATDEDLEYA